MEIDPPTFLQQTDTPKHSELETNSCSSLDIFPRKRPLHQDDPFFQEGTYEYKAAWLRLEDADAYIPDLNEPENSAHRMYVFTFYDYLRAEVVHCAPLCSSPLVLLLTKTTISARIVLC